MRIPYDQLSSAERAALDYRGPDQTAHRIEVFRAAGWQIIDGNDHRLPERPKYLDYDVIRLRATNSRTHGRSLATTWAIRLTKGGKY